jgi:hypothetical protein
MSERNEKPDKGDWSGGKENDAEDRDLGPYGDRDDQLPRGPMHSEPGPAREEQRLETAPRRSSRDTEPPRN